MPQCPGFNRGNCVIEQKEELLDHVHHYFRIIIAHLSST